MSKLLRGLSKGLAAIVVTTLFSSGPALAAQKGWIQNSGGTWSYYKDGSLITNTILTLNNNKKYYLDLNGIMATGWLQIDTGRWSYFYSNGEMAKNTKVDGYYINDSGEWLDTVNKNLAVYSIELGNEATRDGWKQNSDGMWSYYNWGVPVTNTWLTENYKNKYYIKADGKMAIGWTEVSTGEYYYFNSSGESVRNQKIDGYLVNEEGKRTDGQGYVSKNYEKDKPVGNARGDGTMAINYDNVQIFKDGSKTDIWIWNPQSEAWVMTKSLNTVPAKENGKDDNLQNGIPGSISYTDNTYTSVQLAPKGHEYIIAVKWKPRYRGVTIEVYKDGFYSASDNKKNELLFTKSI